MLISCYAGPGGGASGSCSAGGRMGRLGAISKVPHYYMAVRLVDRG
jgi:hypothetical protein